LRCTRRLRIQASHFSSRLQYRNSSDSFSKSNPRRIALPQVRLGWTRLPAEVSDFEITHFFSLRAEERSAVLTRYRDSLRLGAALQIRFLKMCGRPLDAIQRVPANLLKHLGEQLEIAAPTIATLRAL
jgi:Domain of unknown function (DUF4158)